MSAAEQVPARCGLAFHSRKRRRGPRRENRPRGLDSGQAAPCCHVQVQYLFSFSRPPLPFHCLSPSLPISQPHLHPLFLFLSVWNTLCFASFRNGELCSWPLEDRVPSVVLFFFFLSGSFKCKWVTSNRLKCNSN